MHKAAFWMLVLVIVPLLFGITATHCWNWDPFTVVAVAGPPLFVGIVYMIVFGDPPRL